MVRLYPSSSATAMAGYGTAIAPTFTDASSATLATRCGAYFRQDTSGVLNNTTVLFLQGTSAFSPAPGIKDGGAYWSYVFTVGNVGPGETAFALNFGNGTGGALVTATAEQDHCGLRWLTTDPTSGGLGIPQFWTRDAGGTLLESVGETLLPLSGVYQLIVDAKDRSAGRLRMALYEIGVGLAPSPRRLIAEHVFTANLPNAVGPGRVALYGQTLAAAIKNTLFHYDLTGFAAGLWPTEEGV